MHLFALISLALLQAAPQQDASTVPADAYLDAEAGALVAGARAASDSTNALITGYDVTGRQRISAGIRVIGRERPLYLQEIAVDLSWRRDGLNRVEVLGAREAIPVAREKVSVVDDLASDADDLLFDPSKLFLLQMGRPWAESVAPAPPDADADTSASEIQSADDRDRRPRGRNRRDDPAEDEDEDEEDEFDVELIDPLIRNAEVHYQYRTGERTSIRLQNGEVIRLVELQILPRRSTPELVKGSVWLEEASHRAVRGVFTLASPLRFSIPPRGTAAPIPSVTATFEIRHVAVEYGLWDNRWWMPRLTTFEGTGRVAGVQGSVTFEQLYENFRVYSDDPPELPEPDPVRYVVEGRTCSGDDDPCRSQIVLIPRDSAGLLVNEYLPGSIFSREGLAEVNTLREIAALVDASALRSIGTRSPRYDLALFDAAHLRFNRVEGFVFGATGRAELDPFALEASAWTGTGDFIPGGRVRLDRARYGGVDRLELYSRIDAFAPEDRPFSLGSSVIAVLLGMDYGDYYRATGASLGRSFGRPDAPGVRVNAYVERQTSLEKQTDASVPRWVNDRVFRDNLQADAATQYGVGLGLRTAAGLDPTGFRFAADLDVRAETGDFEFVRVGAGSYLSFAVPLVGVGALELGGGSSFGDVPVQRLWYVGGPGTVRGFDPEERMVGTSFWRTRAELGTRNPAARVVVFGDAGSAGDRSDLPLDPRLISVGAGFSTLDGLLRLDVSRAVRGGNDWSVRLRLDAAL